VVEEEDVRSSEEEEPSPPRTKAAPKPRKKAQPHATTADSDIEEISQLPQSKNAASTSKSTHKAGSKAKPRSAAKGRAADSEAEPKPTKGKGKAKAVDMDNDMGKDDGIGDTASDNEPEPAEIGTKRKKPPSKATKVIPPSRQVSVARDDPQRAKKRKINVQPADFNFEFGNQVKVGKE
jgi:hypothetical protein